MHPAVRCAYRDCSPDLSLPFPLLTDPGKGARLFFGLEQVYFLDWKGGRLQKLQELPRLKDPYPDPLIGDLIPGEPERVRLQPPSTGSLEDQDSGKNAADETALSFEEVIGRWQGLHRSPERGFAWFAPPSKRKWLFAMALIPLFLMAL
ncbi:MAG: hypothetical protein VX399_04975 [SAR324 cluster bacterium]|nr:hypothetical protein [SAR324 cluster bacterium]